MFGLIANSGEVTSSVWPSGADLATTSAPINPPLPARFSTTKVPPICCGNFAVR
jgi:hypothetical protein